MSVPHHTLTMRVPASSARALSLLLTGAARARITELEAEVRRRLLRQVEEERPRAAEAVEVAGRLRRWKRRASAHYSRISWRHSTGS